MKGGRLKRENYDKVRSLLSKIEELSNSADMVSDILESIKEKGGIAKIYTHTDGKSYETELTSKTLELVFTNVLSTYHKLIKENKAEIDMILDSTIGE